MVLKSRAHGVEITVFKKLLHKMFSLWKKGFVYSEAEYITVEDGIVDHIDHAFISEEMIKSFKD